MDLHLVLLPSFHRPCDIRISGESTGTATFEARAIGLLSDAAITVPIACHQFVKVREACFAMLSAWDDAQNSLGLDGISILGTCDFSGAEPRAFSLWSPRAGSAAHAMLAAVFECFSCDLCDGAAGRMLEIARSYLALQPPVAVIDETPLRLRLAPWLGIGEVNQVEEAVAALPSDIELAIDASGMERTPRALVQLLRSEPVQRRADRVSWIIPEGFLDVLTQSGIQESMIKAVPRSPLTSRGEPIVLREMIVSSPTLLSLARSGPRSELIRAFRSEYRLTMTQAGQAADELMGIIANVSGCASLA